MLAAALAQPWFPSILAERLGAVLLLTTVLGIAVLWALTLLADSPSFTADCDPDELAAAAPRRARWLDAVLRPAWLLSSGLGAALLAAGLALSH